MKFERPVLAEREHVVGQALSVPVLLGGDLEHDAPVTFGAAVRAKLAEAGATSERWTSWRGPNGWIVKLEFTANDVDHDARWGFEPRRSSLSPQNNDAIQLSRQGSLPEGPDSPSAGARHPAGQGRHAFRQRSFRSASPRTRGRSRARYGEPADAHGAGCGDQARARCSGDLVRDRRSARGPAASPRSA